MFKIILFLFLFYQANIFSPTILKPVQKSFLWNEHELFKNLFQTLYLK